MNIDEDTPQKTEEKTTQAAVQPESLHGSYSSGPIIAAAIGIPVMAGIIVASIFLLPKIEGRDRPLENGSVGENPTVVARSMKKMEVANAEERQAVCNDGSAAAYYFRPATEEHLNDWIIHLHGGGNCLTEEACLDRSERHTSSTGHPNTVALSGIFDPSAEENPDFYNWNHVQIIYCSSDGWSGDGEQVIDGETWYFHGRDIVTAVIEDLQNPEIIETATLADGERLIFAGSSAGGGGVSKNVDYVASLLPEVEVKGFIDSSYGVTIDPYKVPEELDGVTYDAATNFQNRSSDASCMADHPEEIGYCTNLDRVYPYIETPVYVFNNQFDQNRLGNYGITNFKDPAQRAWVEETYLPVFLESIQQVDPVFSPALSFHTLLTQERFFTTELEGVSVAEAFANWYFDRGGETRYVEIRE